MQPVRFNGLLFYFAKGKTASAIYLDLGFEDLPIFLFLSGKNLALYQLLCVMKKQSLKAFQSPTAFSSSHVATVLDIESATARTFLLHFAVCLQKDSADIILYR